MSLFKIALFVQIVVVTSIDPIDSVLHWFAPFFSGGGYCSEATAFITALHSVNYTKLHIDQHGDSFNQDYVDKLTIPEKRLLDIYSTSTWKPEQTVITMCHSEPGAWHAPWAMYNTNRCPPKYANYRIGRSMFETDRLPHGWHERLNFLDEIWVPTNFAKQVFIDSGVLEEKIRVVWEPVDSDFFHNKYHSNTVELLQHSASNQQEVDLMNSLKELSTNTTIFLFVGKFEKRKGIDLLLQAYLQEFTANDSVLLILLTSAYHSTNDFDQKVKQIIVDNDLTASQIQESLSTETATEPTTNSQAYQPPNYRILTGLSNAAMPFLYSYSTALVIPSHGEGWGRPHIEAMSCGVPVIATNWSGPTQFLTEENGYPIPVTGLVPADGWLGHNWAQPDVQVLRQHLRSVLDSPQRAKAKGVQARDDVLAHYSLQKVGRYLLSEIARIEKLFFDRAVDLEALRQRLQAEELELTRQEYELEQQQQTTKLEL